MQKDIKTRVRRNGMTCTTLAEDDKERNREPLSYIVCDESEKQEIILSSEKQFDRLASPWNCIMNDSKTCRFL